MRSAADRGLNFFDNSWDYNDGESEKRMGEALQDGYRCLLYTSPVGRAAHNSLRQALIDML